MQHTPAPDEQGVGNEAPVASAPVRLRAHQCARARPPAVRESPKRRLKLLASHVVGVPAEGFVLPAAVGRVGRRTAEPAECGLVPVVDAPGGEVSGQSIAAEMRVPPRSGDASHVDELAYAHGTQEVQ